MKHVALSIAVTAAVFAIVGFQTGAPVIKPGKYRVDEPYGKYFQDRYIEFELIPAKNGQFEIKGRFANAQHDLYNISGTVTKSGKFLGLSHTKTNKNKGTPFDGQWDAKEGGFVLKDAFVEGDVAVATNEKDLANFTGKWNTSEASFMEMTQSGTNVKGTYNYAGGKMQGSVRGRKLVFTWEQQNDRSGKGEFTMSATSNDSFSGTWSYTKPTVAPGKGWSGTKIKDKN